MEGVDRLLLGLAATLGEVEVGVASCLRLDGELELALTLELEEGEEEEASCPWEEEVVVEAAFLYQW